MMRMISRYTLLVIHCFYAFSTLLFFLLTVASFLLSSCIPEERKEGLVSYRSNNIIGYENKPIIVDSQFLPAMYKIDYYAKQCGVTVFVTSSFRAQNQCINQMIVKPAKMSNHLAGHAIDMNIQYNGVLYDSFLLKKSKLKKLPKNVKSFINDIEQDKTLRWGGNFKDEDPVHIDDALNQTPRSWQERYNVCQYY